MGRGVAWLIAAIVPLGSAPATSAEAGDPLHLSVACGGVKECRYSGGDLRFRIRLKNAGASALEIPIAYLRRAGPIVRLAECTAAVTRICAEISPTRICASASSLLRRGGRRRSTG